MKKFFSTIKQTGCFTIIMTSFFLWPEVLMAKMSINITHGNTQPVPVAVVPFSSDTQQVLPIDVAAVISNDLELSGQFDPVPPANFLSFPSDTKSVYYPDWQKLKVKYLLTGYIKKYVSGNYRIDYYLFDVDNKKTMLSGYVEGQKEQLRPLSHSISDQVYHKITGTRGIFSTKLLYVIAQRDKPEPSYELIYADMDGYRPVTIVKSTQPILSPAWSPNQNQIVYTTYTKNSQQIVYLQDLTTKKRQVILQGYAMSTSPVFSPDGTKLAMAVSGGRESHIYIKDLKTGKLKQLTSNSGVLDTEPDWMPGGQSIVFTSNRGGSVQIYKMDLKSQKITRLTFEGTFNARAKVFPDGCHIVMVTKEVGDKDFHIAILNIKTGNMKILSTHPLEDSPSIAPNGKMLIFSSFNKDRYVLEIMTTNGKVSYNLPVAKGDAQEPAWSPFM